MQWNVSGAESGVHHCLVQRTRTVLGARDFAIACAVVSNSLPTDLQVCHYVCQTLKNLRYLFSRPLSASEDYLLHLLLLLSLLQMRDVDTAIRDMSTTLTAEEGYRRQTWWQRRQLYRLEWTLRRPPSRQICWIPPLCLHRHTRFTVLSRSQSHSLMVHSSKQRIMINMSILSKNFLTEAICQFHFTSKSTECLNTARLCICLD